MKYLLTILFLVSFAAFAQEPIYNQMKSNYQFRGVRVDTLMLFPKFSDTSGAVSVKNIHGSLIRVGTAIFIRDTLTKKWLSISGSSIDTTSLSNRINSKADTSLLNGVVYFSDTLTYIATKNDLSPPIDTTSLSNRINAKVDSITKVSDSVKYWKNGTAYFAFKDSAGSGAGQNLQQVTDVGNTTTNDIQFTNDNDLLLDTFSAVILSNNSRLQEGYIDAEYGGNHGVALVCGLGYELKWEGGRLFVMNNSGNAIREARYMFSDVPDSTHDFTKGYYVGSRWVLDNGDLYVCTDNSLNAAVWVLQPNAFDSTSLSNRIDAIDLQKVTDVGNVTTNAIKVDSLYIWDNANAGYARLGIADNNFQFATYNGYLLIGVEPGQFIMGNDLGLTANFFYTTLSQSRSYILPDTSGTVALRGDSTLFYTKYRSDTSRSNIYAAIGSKMNYSDTASLSNRINNKVDSVTKSTDSVKYWKNGSSYYAFTDVSGGQNGRWGNDTATIVLAKVRNSTATTMARGTVVMLKGATGDVASVIRANNKADSTSARTIGLVKDPIAAGDTGWVVTQGQASKLNLGAYTEGDVLYLDSLDGQLTKTKPHAPYHQVFIGIVERANNGNGLLYTKPQNGYELDEIHDVQITNPINNQVLVYSDTQDLWKNRNVYSVVDTSSLSNRIDAKPNLNATSGYVPYNDGSNFADCPINYDPPNGQLKLIVGGDDNGWRFISGNATMDVGWLKTSNNDDTYFQYGPALITSRYNNSNIGFKLDYATNDFNIGKAGANFQVKDDSLMINGLLPQSGDSVVNISNSGKLGKISISDKLNISDSSIYQTKFSSDTMRTNIYSTINGKPNTADVWLKRDTIAIASFTVGSAVAGDTAAFSTSTLAGSFYNDGTDTLFITSYRVALQGASASITPDVWFNDSLNVTTGGTKLVNSPSAITNTTTGTSVTPNTNKIPQGNWVFVKFGTITTKPTYFSLTLFGYRIRK